MSRGRLLAGLLAAALTLAGCAAQCGPPGGGPPGSGGPGGRSEPPRQTRGGPPAEMGGTMPRGANSAAAARQMMIEQNNERLAKARSQLAISAQQSTAWDSYASSVGALMADVLRAQQVEPQDAGGLQRLDLRVDAARNRYAAIENVADAMRALYASLSDDQRRTADRVLPATVPTLYGGALISTLVPGPVDRPGVEAAPRDRTDRRRM